MLAAFYGSFAQKKIIVAALVQADFAATNLAENDAGFGATLAMNAFAQKTICNCEWKGALIISSEAKTCLLMQAETITRVIPTIVSVKAGPEFFFTKKLSLAGLYGYASYSLFDLNVKEDAAKFILTAHLGKQNRVVSNVYFQNIFRAYPVHFLGSALVTGYCKFLLGLFFAQ